MVEIVKDKIFEAACGCRFNTHAGLFIRSCDQHPLVERRKKKRPATHEYAMRRMLANYVERKGEEGKR